MSFASPFNPARTAPVMAQMLGGMQQNGASQATQDWQSPVFNRLPFGNTPMDQQQQAPFSLQNVVGMEGEMPWGTRK